MAAVPGKNKLERALKFYADNSAAASKDLTADLVPGSLGFLGKDYEFIDFIGVGDAHHSGLPGWWTNTITAKFHVNDTATTGAHTVLAGNAGGSGTVLIELGDAGAAPTTGDLTWSGEYIYLGPKLTLDGGKWVEEWTFQPQAGQTAPAFGTKA